MNINEILQIATEIIESLKTHTIDIISIKRPKDITGVLQLAKLISKLSPIIGNLLEYAIVEYLNENYTWPEGHAWMRQDPDFPDAIFTGSADPKPGFELKAWFPLATEMTARFRESQGMLLDNAIKVVVVCWIPDFMVAGRPKVLDIWIGDALAFAQARDLHYHQPPRYLVIEPEDTSARTRNLQQRNSNGYVFQGTSEQLREAVQVVSSWGESGKLFSHLPAYQQSLRSLRSRFPYRLDTNFAKIDRIMLSELEAFKMRVMRTMVMERSIAEWVKVLSDQDVVALQQLLDPDAKLQVE